MRTDAQILERLGEHTITLDGGPTIEPDELGRVARALLHLARLEGGAPLEYGRAEPIEAAELAPLRGALAKLPRASAWERLTIAPGHTRIWMPPPRGGAQDAGACLVDVHGPDASEACADLLMAAPRLLAAVAAGAGVWPPAVHPICGNDARAWGPAAAARSITNVAEDVICTRAAGHTGLHRAGTRSWGGR